VARDASLQESRLHDVEKKKGKINFLEERENSIRLE